MSSARVASSRVGLMPTIVAPPRAAPPEPEEELGDVVEQDADVERPGPAQGGSKVPTTGGLSHDLVPGPVLVAGAQSEVPVVGAGEQQRRDARGSGARRRPVALGHGAASSGRRSSAVARMCWPIESMPVTLTETSGPSTPVT